MLPVAWLRSFLKTQGLDRPDGRMLFSYRLTDDDYSTLRESLSFITGLYRLSAISKVDGFPAAFVLFASEWWRRDYQGGDWTWSPIIKAFGGNPDELSPGDRSECVRKGLNFWGHQPQSEGMRFFGSIVAQAGLPLNLLARQSGTVAELLTRTIRLAGRYRWNEELIFQHITQHGNDLPQSLRLAEIYQLLTQMVTTALDFRMQFKRTTFRDPLKFLEAEPEWRLRFPLPLGNAQAEVLLQGLVKEATQIESMKNAIIGVQRLLRDGPDGSYELYSQVQIPKNTDAVQVAGFFHLAHEDGLPRYFSIDLLTADKCLLTHGRQLLSATKATVAFTESSIQCFGQEALCEHRAQLRSDQLDEVCIEVPLPGGAELEQGSIWVFATRQERLTLVACGSVRLPDDTAIVSTPNENWKLEHATDCKVERLGDLYVNGLNRPLYQVQGELKVVSGPENFRILTSQPVEETGSYVWFGSRLAFDSTPKALFLGIPKLYRFNADGEQERIPDSKLVWKKFGSPDPIKDPGSINGHVEVRLMDDETVVARYRMVVVSRDAKISFASGEDESQGEIFFEGWGAKDYSTDDEGVTCKLFNNGRLAQLQLDAHDRPPEVVQLRLHWSGENQDLTLKLPFPSTGGRFFDAEGRELEQDACLTADELPGLRLRVFDRNPDKPRKYEVRLMLKDPFNPRGVPGTDSRHPLRLAKGGVAEVRLVDFFREIEILLGFSRHLDAAVEVSLFVSGQPVKSVRIRRYDADLVEEAGQLVLTARGGRKIRQAEFGDVYLSALPLHGLDSQSILLQQSESQGVATGAWALNQLDEGASPWFVYPTPNSTIKFRPTIWGVGSSDQTDQEENLGSRFITLNKAIALQDSELRSQAIGQALDQMAIDFHHPSWPMLEAMWQNLSHLPLSSLDTWRELSGNTRAFTAALFKLEVQGADFRRFIVRFQTELGTVLELATLPMWRDAAARFKQYLEGQFDKAIASQVVPILLKARIDAIAEAAPSVSILLDIIRYEQLDTCSEQILRVLSSAKHDPYRFTKELHDGADSLLQKILLRAHIEDVDWPASHLFAGGLNELYRVAEKKVQLLIEKHIKKLFWSGHDDLSEAANVPVLCALWAVSGASHQWWTEQRRLELQRIRVFDSVWFEQAFSHGVAFAIANHFS